MKREPHRYAVSVTRGGQGGGRIESPGRPTIVGGAPPEFGGSALVWSPEHLLVSAAGLCFLTTLEWFAKRQGLPLVEFRCAAEGTVEKTPTGLAFTGLTLNVDLVVSAGDAARARDLLDVAKKSCLIGNSLIPPIDLVAAVSEVPTIGTTLRSA